MLRASLLGLIFSMKLDGRKDIQSLKSVKSAWSISYSERKAHVLPATSSGEE